MLKQLTLAAFAAALLPACILTTDNTTTDVSTSGTGSATDGTGSATDGTGATTGTASGTTTEDSSTTVDVPTTDGPTTDGTTTATTDATTTVGTTTTDSTTGSSAYGMCGWFADGKYYACAVDGAAAGVEDPDGFDPIACPPDLVVGDKCDNENGPINSVGCCTPEGTVYFCDTETDPNAPVIVTDECGA